MAENNAILNLTEICNGISPLSYVNMNTSCNMKKWRKNNCWKKYIQLFLLEFNMCWTVTCYSFHEIIKLTSSTCAIMPYQEFQVSFSTIYELNITIITVSCCVYCMQYVVQNVNLFIVRVTTSRMSFILWLNVPFYNDIRIRCINEFFLQYA